MSAAAAPPPAIPRVRLSGVRKAFGPKVVLDNVDIEIATGESLVLVGGSGSGKSVTLKCLLGLLRPDAGSIQIDGAETVGLSGDARDALMGRIGMVFQSAALFDSLTVWENVAFLIRKRDTLAPDAARAIAIEKLAMVGLKADVADRRPAALSIGMQKRVGLARAIAHDPDILLFDEPTTGLDPIMGDLIDQLIRGAVTEVGATALTITHDMHSAKTVGDRIAMLYRGRIVWDGPVGEIDACGHAVVEQFVHGRTDGPIRIDPRA